MTDWADTYEQAWRARAHVLDALVAEERSLARVLTRFDRFDRNHQLASNGNDYAFFPVPGLSDPLTALEVPTRHVSLGRDFQAGRFTEFGIDHWLAEMSLGADCVVELGSGYGRRLLGSWLAGGEKNARYVAAEHSAAGRELTLRLAALEPELAIEAHPFDFAKPALPDLKGFENIFLFTSWSVMYANPFDETLVTAIGRLPGQVTCAFIEPIGFQIADTGEDAKLQKHQFVVQGLNLDFYEKLTRLAPDAGIEIVSVVKDAFGDVNNSLGVASVIVCQKT